MNRMRTHHLLVLTSLCLAMSLPWIGMLFDDRPATEMLEARRLATLPTAGDLERGFVRFSQQLEAYVKDNFGFRRN